METTIEAQIAAWRGFVTRRAAMAVDVDELEDHLRDQIAELAQTGLTPDEAFLVAVRRMGRLDDLSREFAREHSDRLWKQLVIGESAGGATTSSGLVLAVALAVGAGLAIKLPALLGVDVATTMRNAGVLVLPFLAALFLLRRRATMATTLAVVGCFGVVAVLVNVAPTAPGSMTAVLTVTHAPVLLWSAVCLAYMGGAWRSSAARMNAIRFTGEWVIYLTLIALGGGVLSVITVGAFGAVAIDVQRLVVEWVLPCGAAGAVIIAAWLVEAKQSVIENMAPVLTKVFTPLFTVLLLALLAAGAIHGNVMDVDRGLLIVFDLVLIVVLGLLLYALSAREPAAPASWFDRLQLVMVAAAIVVDVFVLTAMIGRIGEWGASPNKVASLGLNVILLVNLLIAGVLQWRFVRGRLPLASLEQWHTSYLPVYAAWALVVIGVLPPLFGYV